ncbi:TPA: Mov34/MPN/PAD-1 family protein [Enterococcus faecalis]
MIHSNRLIKYLLPDGNELIIHAQVINTLLSHTQKKFSDPESGGFLLGYENKKSSSIIVEDVTIPQKEDRKSSTHFMIKDNAHINFLEKAEVEKSFFLGTWHTHPQDYVTPSITDWRDWKKSRKKERPGARYMIFIIVGRKEIGVWCVDMTTIFKRATKLVKKVGEQH